MRGPAEHEHNSLHHILAAQRRALLDERLSTSSRVVMPHSSSATIPGATAPTRIPGDATWRRSVCTRPWMACLDALETGSQWISVCPEIELVTRMSPERWVIMCGSTAWMQRRTPLTFTSKSRARASGSPVGELSGDVHPGVCKEYVDAAEALARLLDQAGDVSARGDVRGHGERRGPKLLLQGAKFLP